MSKKIVLADDEKFIAIAYKDGLRRAGYDVTAVNNGLDAIEKIREVKPDLVLLDLIMPKVNGFDVLRKVKSDPDLRHIPVVVLSNLSQPTDEAEVRGLGAIDFLVKSDVSLQQLVARIKELLAE